MATKKQQEVALYEPDQFLALRDEETGAMVVEQIRSMGVSQFDLPQLRVPAGGATSWEIQTLAGPESVREIECVLLKIKSGLRKWWRADLDEKEEAGPPDCSSLDGITGVGHRDLSPPKDGEEATRQECVTCPWSQWGSDRGGRKGQDCTEYGLALCLLQDGLLPSVLQVPTASLRGLRQYALGLLNAGKTAQRVVTRLSLEKVVGTPAYSQVVFRYGGDLSEDAARRVQALSGVGEAFEAFARRETQA